MGIFEAVALAVVFRSRKAIIGALGQEDTRELKAYCALDEHTLEMLKMRQRRDST